MREREALASRLAIVAMLALAGELVLPAPGNGDQRFIQAAARGDVAAVRLLQRERVDVNATDAEGSTALHWAVWGDDLETTDALIRAGANAAAANAFGITPAYVAAGNGNVAIVRKLLDAGADANTADRTGDTLLMAAVRTGKIDAVRLLLDRGAEMNAAESTLGHTVLMWAVRENNLPR